MLRQLSALRNKQRQLDACLLSFFPCEAQEVISREPILEGDENERRNTVILDRPSGRVVAQVGRQPGGHGRGPYRTALPLEEERLLAPVASQHAEGVGLDRAQTVVEAEVARGPLRVGRVSAGSSRSIEPVRSAPPGTRARPRCVRDCAAAGALERSLDVAPNNARAYRIDQLRTPATCAVRRSQCAIAAGEEGEAAVGEREPKPSFEERRGRFNSQFAGTPNQLPQPCAADVRAVRRDDPLCIQGQSPIRSRARFSDGPRRAASIQSGGLPAEHSSAGELRHEPTALGQPVPLGPGKAQRLAQAERDFGAEGAPNRASPAPPLLRPARARGSRVVAKLRSRRAVSRSRVSSGASSSTAANAGPSRRRASRLARERRSLTPAQAHERDRAPVRQAQADIDRQRTVAADLDRIGEIRCSAAEPVERRERVDPAQDSSRRACSETGRSRSSRSGVDAFRPRPDGAALLP